MGEVLTGAIAIIKSGGKICGKIKSWSLSEQITRGDVTGIGTIFSSEVPVLKYRGTLAVSAMSVSYKDGVIPNAIRRTFSNIVSQAVAGNTSFEDNLVLEDEGLTIELYKKVADVIDPVTKDIKPKIVPYAVIHKCFCDSSSLEVSESNISGSNQNFQVLEPPVYSA